MTTTQTAKGYNGTVEFDGQFVTIIRKGFFGRVSVGKGTKRIPVSQITAVQWKQPGAIMNGFIEFSLAGGNESKSTFGHQTVDAANNENAVIVTKKEAKDFEPLRAEIESAISASHGAGWVSSADELAKFAKLHDQGVISDAEFTAAKAKILGA